MAPTQVYLVLIAAVGTGLNAGLFFIFSACIMAALGRLPAQGGIAAMNAINDVIQNPLFFLVFLGTAVVAVAVLVVAFMHALPGSGLAIAASLVFLAGTIGVTIVVNVPMNNALAAVAPTDPQAATLWSGYLSNWTTWNHVRSVASFASLVLFVLAYGRMAGA